MPIPSLQRRTYGYQNQRRQIQPKKKRKIGLKSCLMFFLSAGVICFLLFTVMVAWASRDLPDPDKLTDRHVAQSTKIYDRTGEHLLYEIFASEKRTIVELDQVPKDLVHGVVATEDNKFYEHKGVQFSSFARAIIYRLLGKSSRLGATSTLTQQLVKNAILTNERSVSRKIKEIILSMRLEQKYNKDQILKIYFNEIPYGSTNYGVEAAAQDYFGKHVSELNLAESATLAGIPKAPTKYLNNLDALKNRRDFVLERMVAEGYISREAADEAQAQPLNVERHFGNMIAPHFVLYVKEQLVNKFGEQMVDTGGLHVLTTLDYDKQLVAEKAIKDFEKKLEEGQANNAALVSMDPKSGQILAMVGSRDFNNKDINGQFNVATQGKRQPGSSFKPIIFTAAFEKGYTPDTVLFDVKTNFAVGGAKSYEPENYDLQERGPVTMRQALQGSLNIPAVQTLYLVGPKNGIDFAQKLGYTTLNEGGFGLSLVLGGGEVKLLEHVNAFGIFANGGKYYPPISVLKVESPDGDVLSEWKPKDGVKVLDEKVTATISNVLSDDAARAYIFGAGSALTLPDRSVAAKTGTTNNYRDAWTVGYTPSLVTGVWVGNTDNKEMRKGDGGSKMAAPIWHAYMVEALKNSPVENFPELPPNEADKPILKGSTGGSVVLAIDSATGKLASSSTPPELVVQKTFMPAHSILYYVNKDDPRGSAPEDPTTDPQYQVWEDAIQDWVKRMKEKNPNWQIDFSEPPTEYDDEHSLALVPTLEIVLPAPSSTLTNRQIDTDIRVSAPRGVAKVTYRLDRRYVDVVTAHPFNLNYYANWLEAGEHELEVIVEDDIGNLIKKSVGFTLNAPAEPPSAVWQNKDTSFGQSSFPKMMILKTFKIDEMKEIIVYSQNHGGVKQPLATISDLSKPINDQVGFVWKDYPGAGSYILSVELKLKDGKVLAGAEMEVSVQ